MIHNFLKEIDCINLIDIGCSGSIGAKWRPLEKYIHLIGFDPNKRECERLSGTNKTLLNARFLPYAIAGKNGSATLYKTKSIYCYSLLKPNLPWLRRFAFSDLFEMTGTEKVKTRTLDSINEVVGMDVDVIKIDSQGLELPILLKAEKTLEKTFYVETETGFTKNYDKETTYAEIDEFMRKNFFLLFDINTNHRISRKNLLQKTCSGEQILWCEAVWLKDYIRLYREKKFKKNLLDRKKAIKSLILCSFQRCYSFGYELAEFFAKLGYISVHEKNMLKKEENWRITRGTDSLKSFLPNFFFDLLNNK